MAETYIQVNIQMGGRLPAQLDELADVRLQDSPVASLISILNQISGGSMKGRILMAAADDTGTAATTTIDCSRVDAAGDYVRCAVPGGAITLTEGADFLRGASDTETGENLAAAINAHAVLGKIWAATEATGTVTLTCRFGHWSGVPNDIGWTTDDATAFNITNDATSAPTTTHYSILDKS